MANDSDNGRKRQSGTDSSSRSRVVTYNLPEETSSPTPPEIVVCPTGVDGRTLASCNFWPSASDIPSCATSPLLCGSEVASDVVTELQLTGLDDSASACTEKSFSRRASLQGSGSKSNRFMGRTEEYNPDPQPVPGSMDGQEVMHNPVHMDFFCGHETAEHDAASPSTRRNRVIREISQRDKIVVVMVGLPARGKSHIARRIQRYMDFFHGVPSRIFNIGSYRRKLFANYHPPSFFDPNNKSGMEIREQCLNAALEDLQQWVDQHNICLGLLDATNTTRKRRRYVLQRIREMDCKVIFCESVVTDQALIDRSIRQVKTQSADFVHVNRTVDEVLREFKERIKNYESVYEPISETDPEDAQLSWIKVINTTKFLSNHIYGHYPCHILSYLMSCHLEPRTFYLVRHGQSEYDAFGKIGGDSELTTFGLESADSLAVWMREHLPEGLPPVQVSNDPSRESSETVEAGGQLEQWSIPVFTSTLRADNQMAEKLVSEPPDNVNFKIRHWRNLDQVYCGDFDGYSAKDIRTQFPGELELRKEARLTYRYPRGESFADLIIRLQSVINAMEQSKKPIIVIAHHAVLSVIYAYWRGLDRDKVPFVRWQPHHITKLDLSHYGCTENTYEFMAPVTPLPKSPKLPDKTLKFYHSNDSIDAFQHVPDGDVYNPTPQPVPGTDRNNPEIDNPVTMEMAQKDSLYGTSRASLVIVLVGLPARGKSHVAKKIKRYLSFFHALEAKSFRVPDYLDDDTESLEKVFALYSLSDPDVMNKRQVCYELALADLKQFMRQGSQDGPVCGILDGSAITRSRRLWIRNQLRELDNTRLLFVECDVSDRNEVNANVMAMVQQYPDFGGHVSTVLNEFHAKCQEMTEAYQPLSEFEDCTWIKLSNSQRVEVNKPVHDVTMPLILFLMNVHNKPHVFFVSRHGQSLYNAEGKIGGDSDLTANGELYAKKLAVFADKVITRDASDTYVPTRLWTSTLRRTNATVKHIQSRQIEYKDSAGRPQTWLNCSHRQYRNLDEIYAGDCDGLTYQEIQERYPEEFSRRQKHRLAYRYPRGESYLDLIQRLHPIILEMERLRENLLIVAHQAVIRMILAYWTDVGREEAAKISVPLNTVLKITCQPFHTDVERMNVMEVVSLHHVSSPVHMREPHSFHSAATLGGLSTEALDPPSH